MFNFVFGQNTKEQRNPVRPSELKYEGHVSMKASSKYLVDNHDRKIRYYDMSKQRKQKKQDFWNVKPGCLRCTSQLAFMIFTQLREKLFRQQSSKQLRRTRETYSTELLQKMLYATTSSVLMLPRMNLSFSYKLLVHQRICEKTAHTYDWDVDINGKSCLFSWVLSHKAWWTTYLLQLAGLTVVRTTPFPTN